MTERRASGADSFWTWRDLMYRYLKRLSPEHVAVIAELAFLEMLEAGFAAVGEFHYLHHAPDGQPYDDLAEMSAQILSAASTTGIGVTHLPVLYCYGGLDRQALVGGQKRFGNTLDAYLRLRDRCQRLVSESADDARLGIAPHSLRAIAPEDLAELLETVPKGPVHIHIAEQTREVTEVKAAYGTRPVCWLMANADVSPRWCLIHATHMDNIETRAFAASGAVAGLCPVTEANLGDGVFPAKAFREAHGSFGIGTDSNINIGLSDEVRMLEYGQRLTHRVRNVLAPEDASVGRSLYLGAARGGAQALDRDAGAIRPGQLADLVALDGAHPALCALEGDQLFDGWIFAACNRVVTDVWSAGRHPVRDGQHIDRDRIQDRFRKVMAELRDG